MSRLPLALLLVSIFATGAVAQVPADNSKATIYVYRRDRDFFIYSFVFTRKLNVMYAGPEERLGQVRRIARLKGKHYFTLEVPAGKYYFGTKSTWSVVELDVAAGGKYYVRYDHGVHCSTEDKNLPAWEDPSCVPRMPYVELVRDERVIAKDLADLKPIGKSDRKDSIAQIPTGK